MLASPYEIIVKWTWCFVVYTAKYQGHQ